MTTRIVFTGGGTAGHVTPNLPLITTALSQGFQVHYLGSKNSVEEEMIKRMNWPFHPVLSGKLRRYFSFKTLSDPFKVLAGIGQAYFLLRRLKTDLVFSKGGFVAFPVVVAAWLNRIPVIAHESDKTPGLANRLSFPFVNKICVNFEETKSLFKKKNKVIVTGTPIREDLFKGDKEAGLKHCQFHDKKPCILVMGGSLGSQRLNEIIRQSLPLLNQQYQVIHLCGRGKLDHSLEKNKEYCQFEYANENLADLFAAASLVISRSGANALYEILALRKPHVLIPLPLKVSRGDQIENAHYFENHGISFVINDERLSQTSLMTAIDEIRLHEVEIIKKMNKLDVKSATTTIFDLIREELRVESREFA